MRIDAHQHFWRYSSESYPWIKPEWEIRRDFLPDHLPPLLQSCQLDCSIAVQARQTLEETRWLLELADEYSFICGVVGWIDLCSERILADLEEFAKHPKLIGLRHVVQDEPDDSFMLREDFQRGIAHLQRFNLTYDILIYPRQLPAAIELVRAFPNQRFVLDHLAKPRIAEHVLSPWDDQIRTLAKEPNVACKLSGLLTESSWNNWRTTDFEPYLEIVSEAFGTDRLIFGSDWPVALLAGNYAQTYTLINDYFSKLSQSEQARIFGENAIRFYPRLVPLK
jgi:L-fuconolactonase